MRDVGTSLDKHTTQQVRGNKPMCTREKHTSCHVLELQSESFTGVIRVSVNVETDYGQDLGPEWICLGLACSV